MKLGDKKIKLKLQITHLWGTGNECTDADLLVCVGQAEKHVASKRFNWSGGDGYTDDADGQAAAEQWAADTVAETLRKLL